MLLKMLSKFLYNIRYDKMLDYDYFFPRQLHQYINENRYRFDSAMYLAALYEGKK